jgi:hypothetical protein
VNRPVRLDVAFTIDVAAVSQIAALRVVEVGVPIDGDRSAISGECQRRAPA